MEEFISCVMYFMGMNHVLIHHAMLFGEVHAAAGLPVVTAHGLQLGTRYLCYL